MQAYLTDIRQIVVIKTTKPGTGPGFELAERRYSGSVFGFLTGRFG